MKDKIQNENEIPSDYKPLTYKVKQLEDAESRRNHKSGERKPVSHEMTTWWAAAGIQRVMMRALSKGIPQAAARSQEQPRGSRNEHLGSTRPSTRPRDGDIREQRPDAALDVLGGARERTRTDSTRHMMTGQSMQACLRREVPTDHEAHSQAQRRQLRRVATTELRRERAPEAEAEHAKHDRIRTQDGHLTRMTAWRSGQSTRPRTARERECGEESTWVSKWTSEQVVEPAKTFCRNRGITLASGDAGKRTQLET